MVLLVGKPIYHSGIFIQISLKQQQQQNKTKKREKGRKKKSRERFGKEFSRLHSKCSKGVLKHIN